MTNLEKHKDELVEKFFGHIAFALALVDGEIKACSETSCSKCEFAAGEFDCTQKSVRWLNEEAEDED